MEAIKNRIRTHFPFLVYLYFKGEPFRSFISVISVIGSIKLFYIEEFVYGFMFFATTLCLSYLWQKRCTSSEKKRLLAILMQQENTYISPEFILDKQEARNILPGQEMLRSPWLKNALQTLWPTYLSTLLQQEMDKVYKSNSEDSQYISQRKKVLTFKSFVVNQDYAPSINDITISETATRKDEIVISAYVKFYGNIKFSLASMARPMLLRDVYFREEARIILRPLQSHSPFVGGFAFSLCEKPVMDYNFDAEFKRLFANDEDFTSFQEFLVSRVSDSFVAPNKIYIQFGEYDSLEISQKVKFPVPLAIASLQVIEAQNLTRTPGEFNATCVLRVGSHRLRHSAKNNHHSPFFDQSVWTVIHDFYEQCEIELFNKNSNGTFFLGSIKFNIKDKVFGVRGKTGTEINGRDIWLPLEKISQGMIHIKFTLFMLSDKEAAIRKLFDQLQGFEMEKYMFPIAVISVYIKDFEKSLKAEKQRKTIASKDNVLYKIKINFEKNKKETKTVGEMKNVYCWDQGFYFFTDSNPFDGKKDLRFTLIEEVHKSNEESDCKEVAKAKIIFNVILEQSPESRDSLTFRKTLSLLKSGTYEAAEFGKLKVVVATRIVEADKTLIERLNTPPEIKAIDSGHKTITSCEQCVNYVKNIFFEEGEQFDVVKQDMDDNIDKDINICMVKLQFSLIERNTLAIEVIRVLNVPIFKETESPESQVIIELWRSNTKVTQRSTLFKPQTRDPTFGRRFKFIISDGNIQRHLIRVLVATKKKGWFRNHITLVAEAFCGIPRLEQKRSAHVEWYKLSTIGIPIRIEQRQNT